MGHSNRSRSESSGEPLDTEIERERNPIKRFLLVLGPCETFNWQSGLNEKFHGARNFYLVIGISTLIGMLINFLKIPPVTALFWTAVLNGVLAPPLIVIIMLVSNNKKVMGNRTNGKLTNVLGWGTAVIMTAAAVGMFATWGR
jgi:Mn2+/Fe2+ NRAMP family transporter